MGTSPLVCSLDWDHNGCMKTKSPLACLRVVSLVLLLTFIATGAIAQTRSQSLGVVEYLEGDVRINGVLADFGDEVAYGDWVDTGRGATIDIVFDGANVFRLGENTVAQIEIGSSRQSVDLKFGSMSAVFDRLRTLTGGGTFDVRTNTVAGGVRGTSFFFLVLDRDTTYVCTCNGTLELDPAGEAEPFVDSATRHSAYFYRNVDGVVVVEQAGLEFHSTEGLNEIADVIGVTVPWGSLPE
jgi:hypothetical protein